MTWCVTGYDQAEVKGFVALHSCLPRKLRVGLGFGLFCWIQYGSFREIKAAVHSELLFLVRLFSQNLDKSRVCLGNCSRGALSCSSVLQCLVLHVAQAVSHGHWQLWQTALEQWGKAMEHFLVPFYLVWVFIAVIQTHHF